MINGIFGMVIAMEIVCIAAMVAAAFAPAKLWLLWGMKPPAWSRAGRAGIGRPKANRHRISEMG
jgi:hypothetical protein